VNWVFDADIRGFFDTIDHGWLLQFVEHRIGDKRIVRLIQKWLKAGVLEEGRWSNSDVGTPQGATISPLLANVYLHYVLDLWVQLWRKRYAHGEVMIVRYADDFVMGFQYESDANRFRTDLAERLQRFNLELHPEKTRLLRLGFMLKSDRKREDSARQVRSTSWASRTFAGSPSRASLACSGTPPRSACGQSCKPYAKHC
jgi:retron-type reverse transcriptase